MATALRDGPLDKVLAGSTLTAVAEPVRKDLLAVEQLLSADSAYRAWQCRDARGAPWSKPGRRRPPARKPTRCGTQRSMSLPETPPPSAGYRELR
jgi:hypothetical protein